jgi:hypothetical protein
VTRISKVKKPLAGGASPAPLQLRTWSRPWFPTLGEEAPAYREEGGDAHRPPLGHNFGEVAVTAPESAASPAFSRLKEGACPLALASPRACPFGGACHTCPLPLQAKPAVSQPGDPSEREADRVAEQVMRLSDDEVRPRRCSTCDTDEDEMVRPKELPGQASPATPLSEVPPLVHEVLRSPGQPLDPATRAFMEPRFGYDFSGVRIHTSAQAAKSAKDLKARAYTVGQNLAFASGEYSPNQYYGLRLIAHELTHVLQQQNKGSGNFLMVPQRIQRQEIEDCSDVYAEEVRVAVNASIAAIRSTISSILNKRSPRVDTAFKTFFGNSAPRYAAYIALRLAIIASKLPGSTIECENPGSFFYNYFCGGKVGYVRSIPAFFGLGNIHLCQPSFHNLTDSQRMALIIHEAAHRYIDADDYDAYYTLDCQETAETRALSDSKRRDHADSYACLVYTI